MTTNRPRPLPHLAAAALTAALVASLTLSAPAAAGPRQDPAEPAPAAAALAAERAAVTARVDALAGAWEELGMFNGAVLVARGDTVLVRRGYGMASYELGVPNTPQTRFRIASLSKPLTAIAIGVLWERGALTPETRLAKLVPEYPPAAGITLRQLLDHRAGVPHLNALPWYEGETCNPHTLSGLVERLRELPFDFEPGSSERYSNGGYALLALVIERASGKSYGDFLAEDVLRPLGMTSTGHDRADLLLPGRASGYLPGVPAGTRAPARCVDPSIKIGGGSLYSTVDDLYRLDRALWGDNLLRAATWEALFPRDEEGDEIQQTGRAPGFYAVYRRLLPDELTVIVLANNYAVAPLADRIPAAVRGEAVESPAVRTDLPAATAAGSPLLGEFTWPAPFGTRFVVRLQPDDGLIYEEPERGARVGVFPQSAEAFYNPLYGTLCSHRPAADDQPERLECAADWTPQPVLIPKTGG